MTQCRACKLLVNNAGESPHFAMDDPISPPASMPQRSTQRGRGDLSTKPGQDQTPFSSKRGQSRGREKAKVLPAPGLLSTQMLPPCASVTSLQNVRPRPVDARFLDLCDST